CIEAGGKMTRAIRNQFIVVAALCCPAFGGQSIRISTQTVSNSSIPAQPIANPWRVEFSIHDWDANASLSHPMDASVVGLDIVVMNLGGGDLRLQMYSKTAQEAFNNPCQIPGLGPGGPGGGGPLYTNRFITVRFQQD